MRDSDWKILDELYKTKNITRAANRLFMTQPSLTKRLKQMEEEFQVTIVERTSKGVAFTPEGELLASKAREYLNFMAGLRRDLSTMTGSEKTIIMLGASYTFSRNELPEIIMNYTQKEPNVKFDLHIEQSNLLFRKVCDGELDAAFIRGDYEGDAEKKLVGQYRAYLITKNFVTLDELPAMHRIDYQTNDKTIEILKNWWKEQFGTDVSEETNIGYSDVALKIIGRSTDYFTLVFLPDNYRLPYELTVMPLVHKDGTPVLRNSWFVYRKRKNKLPALRRFIKYIDTTIAVKM
ncbi:MAG: LysR family transcriptional regulator [Acidaminococcus sp.]|jgi:DNA-binding transcriptional LysR family regulator|nr:LysR family transcriptional regulator [Acidaminococcus sp.]MCI2115357.1 LysR family transcriptional regulator [Acidaminococcus sp.]MCI2117417.1 LysR family transcriptional regulator [Acidaminococcus sp.]